MKNKEAKFKETEIGSIPDEWEILTIYDLAEWINGLAFKNINFSNTGKPVIKINELKYGITGQTQFTNNNFKDAYFLNQGDLLFSWSGSPETSIDAFWYSLMPGWLNQHIFKIINKEKVTKEFLFYILKANKQRLIEIAQDKQTTGLGHVTIADLKRFFVGLPSINEQKRIAEILGALDEKIELNRRMNDTLEKIASAIFKHWFVDFNFPFDFAQGKPSAKGKPYKASDGKMIDSEFGLIPAEWKVSNLGNILKLNYGKALKADVRNDGNIKVYGSSGFVGFHNEKIANGPGIVVGRKGNVGSIYWVDSDFYPIDTTYFVESKFPLVFCYYILKNQNFINGDSVVPGLNREQAYLNQIVLPDSKVIGIFSELALEIRNTISSIEKQNNNLSQIRDSLLPRLMSGKIRV